MQKKLRVLIGCEFSGMIRRAFRDRGHDAWSCDLLDAEDCEEFHLKQDIFSLLEMDWDLLIYHWPCTLLCNSGVRWLYGAGAGRGKKIWQSRFDAMEKSAKCFRKILDCKIPKICGENPIPHIYARRIMGKYSQIIQPYNFGHGETKATCLWLKNLPELKPTNIVSGRVARVHFESPGLDRWKNRSRTLAGIADAMAIQWGNLQN